MIVPAVLDRCRMVGGSVKGTMISLLNDGNAKVKWDEPGAHPEVVRHQDLEDLGESPVDPAIEPISGCQDLE